MKDGKEVNAVMLVGRLFHARATVTRNDRSPMLSRVRGTIRRGQEPDRSRCRDSDVMTEACGENPSRVLGQIALMGRVRGEDPES